MKNYEEHKLGRTTIRIEKLSIDSIMDDNKVHMLDMDQMPWGLVKGETWEKVNSEGKGNNGKTYVPGESQNHVQFQTEWAPYFDREAWAIAGPIYLSDVNTGRDEAKCIKVVADPKMTEFQYTYSHAGAYNPTFVAINSNYSGRSESVKSCSLNLVISGGSIIQPEKK